MTSKQKERGITVLISIGLMIIGGVISQLFMQADAKNTELEEKFKIDIKTEVKKELKPDIDSKLPIVDFNSYVDNHKVETEIREESKDKSIQQLQTQYNQIITTLNDIRKSQSNQTDALLQIQNTLNSRIDDVILNKANKK